MLRNALIMIGLLVASFVDRATSTGTAVVLPWVQGDLALSGDQAPLVALVFNGSYYTGILLGPRLMLRFGRTRYLVYCMVAYGIAALLCAMSQSLAELVVCRVLLGLTEGAFFLAGIITLVTDLPPQIAPLFILPYGAVSQIAVGVAPLVGGAIADSGSWRMLYVVLAAGALGAAALIRASATETPFDRVLERQRAGTRRDCVGAVLMVIALGGYSYITGYGALRDWINSPDVAIAFSIFVAAGVAFFCWERYGAADPIMPRAIFTRRDAWLGLALGLGIGFPMFGTDVLLQYLQVSVGFTPALAGSVIALRALALLIAAPIGSLLVGLGINSRFIVASGFALTALAFVWESTGITSGADFHTFVGAELLIGVGFGLSYAPLLLTVVTNVRVAELPFAVAMMNVAFVSAGSFANSSLSTVFDHRQEKHLADLAGSITLSRSVIEGAVRSGGSTAAHYMGALVAQQSAVLAFADVAICSAGVAALAIPFALYLRPARKLPNLAAPETSPSETTS